MGKTTNVEKATVVENTVKNAAENTVENNVENTVKNDVEKEEAAVENTVENVIKDTKENAFENIEENKADEAVEDNEKDEEDERETLDEIDDDIFTDKLILEQEKLQTRLNEQKMGSNKGKDYSKMTILELIEDADNMLEESRLHEEYIANAQPALHELSIRLGISEDECMWLCAALNQPRRIDSFDFDDINRYFNCRPIRGLKYKYLFDSLHEKEWIIGPNNDQNYGVANWVVEAIRKNEKPEPKAMTGLDVEGWLGEIWDVLNEEKLSYTQKDKHIDLLCEGNSELSIVKALHEFPLYDEMDKQVFLMTVCRFVFENDNHVCEYYIEDLFENRRAERKYIHQLQHGLCILLNHGIEFVNENGQVNTSAWKLTDDAKQKLFAGTDIKITQEEENVSQLVCANKITEKKLYFSDAVTKQVDDLRSILGVERFKEIQDRLKDKGMRRGFACIFYGTPGTGKTETTLQLARETGRDIMQVDISNLRSKWVGDSEKNIKGVFDRYRETCRHAKNAPILLFNEADAIFNKRNEGATKAVDKMENSIQNIILQEMETFDGIMIATTNLTGNLDSAFERRFLYKIEFTKPTPNERKHIWKSMLPELSDEDALSLAKQFDFSGGQIENIARKHVVNTILYGDTHSIESIQEICAQEKIDNKQKRKSIGFC